MRTIALLAIFISSLISTLPLLYAGAERILIESQTVSQGSEARVTIILDSAPSGLAGYDIIVSIKSSGVADILGVDFPEWARLSEDSFNGSDSIRLRAVDLEDKVRRGATNVVLATVIFGNTKQGESLIELIVVRMDDDDGNSIIPSVEPGKLAVVGPTYTQTIEARTGVQTATENTTTHEEKMPTEIPSFMTVLFLAIVVILLLAVYYIGYHIGRSRRPSR